MSWRHQSVSQCVIYCSQSNCGQPISASFASIRRWERSVYLISSVTLRYQLGSPMGMQIKQRNNFRLFHLVSTLDLSIGANYRQPIDDCSLSSMCSCNARAASWWLMKASVLLMCGQSLSLLSVWLLAPWMMTTSVALQIHHLLRSLSSCLAVSFERSLAPVNSLLLQL